MRKNTIIRKEKVRGAYTAIEAFRGNDDIMIDSLVDKISKKLEEDDPAAFDVKQAYPNDNFAA